MLQWHLARLFPAFNDLTQERTFTVAGQWRIFTAFPSIPLLVIVAARRDGCRTIPAAPLRIDWKNRYKWSPSVRSKVVLAGEKASSDAFGLPCGKEGQQFDAPGPILASLP